MADPEEDSGGSEEAVRVFVRIRPLNKRELAAKQTIGWNFNDTSMLQDTQNGQRVYAFDRCFHPDGNNTEVYDVVGKPVVIKALEGFNGTVFTYGQTGSGKTFTMRGNDADPGMMILCIRDIFDYIAASKKRTFELRVSYMEVYNEEINDLLGSGPNSKNLRIVSEDAVKGAVIGHLTEELVGNPAELMEVLARGESSRSYGSTEMNAESSRSHTIYRLAITSKEIDEPSEGGDIDSGGAMYVPSAGGPAAGRLSFMNLVDLAGSERQKSTGASGKTLKEGSNINKSLLSLGAVISKLGEASKKPVKGAKPVFIPYRDSKLTRILKQSLGGNTLTSILCTVTAAPMHIEETVSTLKFGQLCKTIKNNVKNNEVVDDRALLKMYKTLVSELRAQLVEAETTRGRTSSVFSTGGGDGAGAEGEEEGTASREVRSELSKAKKEIEELRSTVHTLNQGMQEAQELEAQKNALDEYQKESEAAIEEERTKMEEEKEALQKQRALMLAEKTQLNEKEGRLGTLLGMLDERESKLRQHLSALQVQQAHWQQSVDTLRQREEQVKEWNEAHVDRQNAIDDAMAELSRQREEMESREVAVSETENQLEMQKKEVADREVTLMAQKNRLAEVEIACTALQDKLSAEQAAVNGRVAYLDSKEKEYSEKQKEQGIMDSLLKEREKQLDGDRKILDEKLETARASEEQSRVRETELEKKATSIRAKESEAVLMAERHSRMLADLEVREMQCQKDANRQTENERVLNEQEARLYELQDQLGLKEITLAAVEEREKELQQRVDAHAKVEEDFYNVKVAQITSRHASELAELEMLVSEQLKISSNFQDEIEKMRTDLKDALHEKSALESMNTARGLLIEKLQLDMAALNSDRRQLSAAEHQSSELPINMSVAVSTPAGPGGSVGPPSGNIDGGDNISDENRSRAAVSQSVHESANAHVFLNQLGATQRMLCKILDAHKQEKSKKERTLLGRSGGHRSRSNHDETESRNRRHRNSKDKKSDEDNNFDNSMHRSNGHFKQFEQHRPAKNDGGAPEALVSAIAPETYGTAIETISNRSPHFAQEQLSPRGAALDGLDKFDFPANSNSGVPPEKPKSPRSPLQRGKSEGHVQIGHIDRSTLSAGRFTGRDTLTSPTTPGNYFPPTPGRTPTSSRQQLSQFRSLEPSSSPFTTDHFQPGSSPKPRPGSQDYNQFDTSNVAFSQRGTETSSSYQSMYSEAHNHTPTTRKDDAADRGCEMEEVYGDQGYKRHENPPASVSPRPPPASTRPPLRDASYDEYSGTGGRTVVDARVSLGNRNGGSNMMTSQPSARITPRSNTSGGKGGGTSTSSLRQSPQAPTRGNGVPVTTVTLSLQRHQNK